MNVFRVMRYGFLQGIEELGEFWNWKTWTFGWMLQTICRAVFFASLGTLLGQEGLFEFMLIGNVVASGLVGTGFAVAASTWDRWDGTYPLLVVAPSSQVPAILGRTAIHGANAIVSACLAFLVVIVLFQLHYPLDRVLLTLPLIAACMIAAYGLMSALGTFAALKPEYRNLIHNSATLSMLAFCGVNVPLTFWPEWLQTAAHFFPLTNGLLAVRLLLAEGPSFEVLAGAGRELLVAAGWLILATLIMDRMADLGRADGSIEFAS